jgi:hypothetical protein
MAVAIIEVPSRGHMANGIGKAILYGIEYDVLSENKVELTCADEMKLAKIIVQFGGKILSARNVAEITPDLPRRESIKI